MHALMKTFFFPQACVCVNVATIHLGACSAALGSLFLQYPALSDRLGGATVFSYGEGNRHMQNKGKSKIKSR